MIHRKILKGLLLIGSLLAGQVYALGLGNITLQSHLNEPLTAKIQLVSAGELSPNEVLVNLAPQEDFDKAMVERSYLLNGLVFQLDLSDSRNPAITVITASPIREPFLDFIVELRSPSGRVLREYTLLLDIAQGGTAREPMRRPAVVVKRRPQAAATKPQPAPAATLAPTSVPAASPAAPVTAPPSPATSVPSATDAAADVAAKAALAAQLAGAQEQANRTVTENEALKKQLADLEKQLADATAQLNNQNAQLQAMKMELDAAIAAKQAAAAPPTATPTPAAATSPPAAAPAEPAVAPTAPVAAPPQPAAAVQPEVKTQVQAPAVPASEPVAQPKSGSSWGTMLTAVVIVLLIAVGLWVVRKRQQQDVAEQAAAPVTENTQEPDSEVDAVLTQFGAEHPVAPQEATAPVAEEKPLTTDEALDLLLADTDFGLSEAPAAPQEMEAPLVDELAADELLTSDDALLPVAELDDWSTDTLPTDAAPIDKDFVFEPELFADSASHEPVVEPVIEPVATQQNAVVDDAFHDATDRDFVVTKLELARQYLEMSDAESARDLLQEVLEEGDEELKQAATDLLQKMS